MACEHNNHDRHTKSSFTRSCPGSPGTEQKGSQAFGDLRFVISGVERGQTLARPGLDAHRCLTHNVRFVLADLSRALDRPGAIGNSHASEAAAAWVVDDQRPVSLPAGRAGKS